MVGDGRSLDRLALESRLPSAESAAVGRRLRGGIGQSVVEVPRFWSPKPVAPAVTSRTTVPFGALTVMPLIVPEGKMAPEFGDEEVAEVAGAAVGAGGELDLEVVEGSGVVVGDLEELGGRPPIVPFGSRTSSRPGL